MLKDFFFLVLFGVVACVAGATGSPVRSWLGSCRVMLKDSRLRRVERVLELGEEAAGGTLGAGGVEDGG